MNSINIRLYILLRQINFLDNVNDDIAYNDDEIIVERSIYMEGNKGMAVFHCILNNMVPLTVKFMNALTLAIWCEELL